MRPQGLQRWAERFGATDLPTLGEGDTPLVPLDNLRRSLGCGPLWAKLESLNPTGSYKDRIAVVSVALARMAGKRGWIATTSGNAGAAMAAYGAKADLPGLLFVVDTMPAAKRAQLEAFGATVIPVRGLGSGGSAAAAAAVFRSVGRAAHEFRLFLGVTAHAFNDAGMRGADSIGWELAASGIRAEACYVPTGGGGLLVAIARGLADSGAPCAMVTAQPAGCAPLVAAFHHGTPPVVAACTSEISALQVPAPPDGELAMKAITASGGWATACADDAILTAQRRLATEEGLLVEPASAAALAALERDLEEGRLRGGVCATLVLTGSGLKQPPLPTAEDRESIAPDQVDQAIANWAG